MDSKLSQPPVTHRSHRASAFPGNYGRGSPPCPQSWHAPPRNMGRPSQCRWRPRVQDSRWLEWKYKTRPTDRQEYWNSGPDKKKVAFAKPDGFLRNLEPTFSSLSVKEGLSNEGHVSPLSMIPQVISPNTREQTFTEIMNGAFDLQNSPKGLGRKLSSAATFPNSWLLQDPINPTSLDTEGLVLSSPTSHRSSKRNASSQTGPSVKQARLQNNSSAVSGDRSFSETGVSDETVQNPSRTDALTIGLSLSQGGMLVESPDVRNLLEMVKLSVQQSRDLANLLSNFLERIAENQKATQPSATATDKASVKAANYSGYVDKNPRTATIGYGGDSPDPPGDHQDPFRGHMIERVDVYDTNNNAGENPEGQVAKRSDIVADTGIRLASKPQILSRGLETGEGDPVDSKEVLPRAISTSSEGAATSTGDRLIRLATHELWGDLALDSANASRQPPRQTATSAREIPVRDDGGSDDNCYSNHGPTGQSRCQMPLTCQKTRSNWAPSPESPKRTCPTCGSHESFRDVRIVAASLSSEHSQMGESLTGKVANKSGNSSDVVPNCPMIFGNMRTADIKSVHSGTTWKPQSHVPGESVTRFSDTCINCELHTQLQQTSSPNTMAEPGGPISHHQGSEFDHIQPSQSSNISSPTVQKLLSH